MNDKKDYHRKEKHHDHKVVDFLLKTPLCLHYLSCNPIASSSRHRRHNYVRDMFLRFLKRYKFVVEKEVLFGHCALSLNPIPPPNLSSVDAIATQLDSHGLITQYDSQIAGNGIRALNPVGEGAFPTQLDSHFSQMDGQVDSDGVLVVVPNDMVSF